MDQTSLNEPQSCSDGTDRNEIKKNKFNETNTYPFYFIWNVVSQ